MLFSLLGPDSEAWQFGQLWRGVPGSLEPILADMNQRLVMVDDTNPNIQIFWCLVFGSSWILEIILETIFQGTLFALSENEAYITSSSGLSRLPLLL